MNKILLLAAAVMLLSSLSAFAIQKSDFIEFQKILDTKCTKCHTRTRIDEAMAEQRDLSEIQARMIKKGAELDTREQQVLGIFFQGYAVKETSSQVHTEDPLAEYRSVVKARCTGCHSLDIIEDVMREKRQFASLAQMMIERGAVLNDKDMKIIQTFWGEPLR